MKNELSFNISSEKTPANCDWLVTCKSKNGTCESPVIFNICTFPKTVSFLLCDPKAA